MSSTDFRALEKDEESNPKSRLGTTKKFSEVISSPIGTPFHYICKVPFVNFSVRVLVGGKSENDRRNDNGKSKASNKPPSMLAQSIASSVHPNTTVSETQRGTAPVPKRRRSPDAVTDPEPHADGRESATPASRIEASDVQSDTNGAAGIKRMRADAASPAAGARGKVDGQRYTGVNALLHLSHAAAREKRRMEVLSGGDVRESGGVKQERGLQLLEEELAVERHYAAMNSLLFQLSKERGRVWDL